MTYQSGEIYFIRERDYFTREVSHYIKIGLVHSIEDRSSEDRMREHQTGNPRPLFLHDVVKTEAVDYVEATLHQLYAKHRISGEWFEFKSDKDLDAVIEHTRGIATNVAAVLPIFIAAEDFAKTDSYGEILEATDELRDLLRSYQFAGYKVKLCTDLQNDMKSLFVAAVEAGEEVRGAVTVTERKGRKVFDFEKFEKAHPDLVAQFTESKTSFKGPWKAAKNITAEMKIEVESEFQRELEMELQLLEDVRKGSRPAYELNEVKLKLIHILAMASWEKELASNRIRVACGTAPGISEICTWKRETITESKFSESKLKSEKPELWEEFTYMTSPVQVVNVLPGQLPGQIE